jgi:hypothetical protein
VLLAEAIVLGAQLVECVLATCQYGLLDLIQLGPKVFVDLAKLLPDLGVDELVPGDLALDDPAEFAGV